MISDYAKNHGKVSLNIVEGEQVCIIRMRLTKQNIAASVAQIMRWHIDGILSAKGVECGFCVLRERFTDHNLPEK